MSINPEPRPRNVDLESTGPAVDELAERLARYDDARACGSVPPTLGQEIESSWRERWQEAKACLDLLASFWGRDTSAVPRREPSGDGDSTNVDAAPTTLQECTTDHTSARLIGPAIRIGKFQIIGDLGRGGCGVVSLAVDPLLGRRVAVKVPWPEYLASDEGRRRFLREARAAAALDHPNIVPIYESGEDGVICYIASAYCEGSSLSCWLQQRGQPMTARSAASLVAALADGIQHAHEMGVLHRDLKPANVLLQKRAATSVIKGSSPHDSQTETPVEDFPYQPRIADFGLAKLLDQPSQDSIAGEPMGSPPYMAAEQAMGRLDLIGPWTDVYGLGAILYEALTFRPPFQGATKRETLHLVLNADPVPPRRLRRELPRDLETICLKCLSKEPTHRYAKASELGDDLRRFLAGETIRARPVGPIGRTWKWARRYPSTAGLLLASMFCVSLPAWFLMWRESNLKNEAYFRVGELEMASIEQAPSLVESLQEVHPREVALLRAILARPGVDEGRKLRAQLGLVPYLPTARRVVLGRMLEAPPDELGVLREILHRYDDPLASRLDSLLSDPRTTSPQRLRAILALMAIADHPAYPIWETLRHSEDPGFRTQLIHWIALSGVGPERLLNRLTNESDPTIRRALIQALGGYSLDTVSKSGSEDVLQRMGVMYCDDPDPGVHASIAWLLRKWGQSDRLGEWDQELMARGSGVGFGWFVNSQGQTMMVVSWPDKPECSGTTRFAISSTEVTWRQFRAFRPEVVSSRYADPSADDQPVYDVDFHSARAYCEWLSRRESLERPFEYRLPTLEEWRFAAAAGASTARHFGDRATFLPEYAQSLVNSGGRPQPVARRKPNDFGLFDTLGNVHEWTLSIEPRRDLPDLHIAAGGSCAVLGENLHTDLQIATIPETTTLLTGFRIVQSLALSE